MHRCAREGQAASVTSAEAEVPLAAAAACASEDREPGGGAGGGSRLAGALPRKRHRVPWNSPARRVCGAPLRQLQPAPRTGATRAGMHTHARAHTRAHAHTHTCAHTRVHRDAAQARQAPPALRRPQPPLRPLLPFPSLIPAGPPAPLQPCRERPITGPRGPQQVYTAPRPPPAPHNELVFSHEPQEHPVPPPVGHQGGAPPPQGRPGCPPSAHLLVTPSSGHHYLLLRVCVFGCGLLPLLHPLFLAG